MKIPVESTPVIYRSCDVLLKLSKVEGMFGPPLEMFHCGGTAITYDVTGSEEYLVSGRNSLVVPMDDEKAVADSRAIPEDGARACFGTSALGLWPPLRPGPNGRPRRPSSSGSSPRSADTRAPAIAQTMLAIRGAAVEMR